MIKDIQFKTHESREIEKNYIISINPKNPGKNFNHDPKIFAQYCRMQLKSFMYWDDGSFTLLYKDIFDAIDSADKYGADHD